jgi:hypothetical protein
LAVEAKPEKHSLQSTDVSEERVATIFKIEEQDKARKQREAGNK